MAKKSLRVFGLAFIALFAATSPAISGEAQQHLETHHHPENWQFTLPKGDPKKGREVFVKYECPYCHEVRGEEFLFSGMDYGPELSQMGPMHPLEFFAESIINPNAVVDKEYRDANGKSPMPSVNDKMTVQELIDVSAYLASLKPKGMLKSATGEGKVIALMPDKNEIVIEHGAIKGVMGAMTMGYKVASPSFLKTVKTGDKIRFTIDTDKRVITKLEKAKN